MDLADRADAFQTMVAMRDGTRLNTFVFLPQSGGPRWPVILHRTPYGITALRCQRQDRLHKGVAAERGRAVPRFDPARLAQHRRARLCRGLPGHSRPPRVGRRGPSLCR